MRRQRDWRINRQTVTRLLKSKGWSQVDLAEHLGLKSQADISRYMNGKRAWPDRHLEKIAGWLGESPAIFYLTDTDHKSGLREAREVLLEALHRLDAMIATD